jgi:dihydroorotase
VDAVIEGLADGTIDMIATDHAPHAQTDKLCTFEEAANGIANLETALGSVLSLVHDGRMKLPELIDRLTAAPARFLGKPLGTLSIGAPADITVFDPDMSWMVDPASFATRGVNTPLAGTRLTGRPTLTVFGGKVVYELTGAEVAIG